MKSLQRYISQRVMIEHDWVHSAVRLGEYQGEKVAIRLVVHGMGRDDPNSETSKKTWTEALWTEVMLREAAIMT